MGGTSRMSREAHVRSCEGLGVQFPGATRRRINGRFTTKTISEEIARECEKRIENYRELQRQIAQAVANAFDQAPWMQGRNK